MKRPNLAALGCAAVAAFAISGSGTARASCGECPSAGFAAGAAYYTAPSVAAPTYVEPRSRAVGVTRRSYFSSPPPEWRRGGTAYFGPAYARGGVYYWSGPGPNVEPPRYFSAPRERVIIGGPADLAGSCGTYRFWNGERCVDARFERRDNRPFNPW